MEWTQYIMEVGNVLSRLVVTDRSGAEVPVDEGFARWTRLAKSLSENGSIHLVGNGASASMASHFATDITKNCDIRANVFTDGSLVTALGNDHGFENAYSIALRRYGRAGDLLVAISSSGNSPNIVNACKEAAGLSMHVVTVSAKKMDNAIRGIGDLNFYVPGENFSLAESSHAVVLHHWTDLLEAVCKKTRA